MIRNGEGLTPLEAANEAARDMAQGVPTRGAVGLDVHRYTLAEIDRIRSVVYTLNSRIRWMIGDNCWHTWGPDDERNHNARNEDEVRTYLMAGITADDMEAKLAERVAEYERDSAAYWADRKAQESAEAAVPHK